MTLVLIFPLLYLFTESVLFTGNFQRGPNLFLIHVFHLTVHFPVYRALRCVHSSTRQTMNKVTFRRSDVVSPPPPSLPAPPSSLCCVCSFVSSSLTPHRGFPVCLLPLTLPSPFAPHHQHHHQQTPLFVLKMERLISSSYRT